MFLLLLCSPWPPCAESSTHCGFLYLLGYGECFRSFPLRVWWTGLNPGTWEVESVSWLRALGQRGQGRSWLKMKGRRGRKGRESKRLVLICLFKTEIVPLFLFCQNIFLFCFVLCAWMFGWVCVCVPSVQGLWRPAEATRSPRTGVTGNCESPWVLGTEPKSSKRTASALNCWGSFSALQNVCFFFYFFKKACLLTKYHFLLPLIH